MGARALPLRRHGAAAVIAACGDDPLGRRDAALVTLMREAMLRGCEAAALVWRDIQTAEAADHAAVVAIRRSKTNTRGTRAEAATISAVALHRLELWQPHAPAGSVFGIAARSVAYVVAAAGRRAGIEGLSGHSCRRGAAQDLAVAGFSAAVIRARGRWASLDSAQRYIEEIGGELGRPVPEAVIV